MSEENSIKALVQLIDDPDDGIYSHVRDELINYGTNAIPFLENSWEAENYGLLFQSRIEDLIQEIQYSDVKRQLTAWIESSNKDLLTGCLIIAKYQYPNIDEQSVRAKIDTIRKDIWIELNEFQTSFEKIKAFNKVFYGSHKFTGNSKDYHSSLNSYINTVLDTKKGNPLSLCVLYSIIAQSLDLPIYGVNLPNHFVLAYMDEDRLSRMMNQNDNFGVLFYINGFSKGGIFDGNEIKEFLKGINKPELREYFEPCSNSAILARMLTNLIVSFQQSGNEKKVKELTELRELFNFNF